MTHFAALILIFAIHKIGPRSPRKTAEGNCKAGDRIIAISGEVNGVTLNSKEAYPNIHEFIQVIRSTWSDRSQMVPVTIDYGIIE
jgi:hypothetical protein